MQTISGCVATASVLLITPQTIFGGDGAGWKSEREAGLRAFEQGKFSESEKYNRKALDALETDSPEAAVCLHNLAAMYSEEGRDAEVADSYRKALQIWEKAPGYEASNAVAQGNLGTTLFLLGRYSEAGAIQLRSLATIERLLGPEHRDTAAALNNLGDIYTAQARYADAETSYRRAAAIREKLLGKDHTDTL